MKINKSKRKTYDLGEVRGPNSTPNRPPNGFQDGPRGVLGHLGGSRGALNLNRIRGRHEVFSRKFLAPVGPGGGGEGGGSPPSPRLGTQLFMRWSFLYLSFFYLKDKFTTASLPNADPLDPQVPAWRAPAGRKVSASTPCPPLFLNPLPNITGIAGSILFLGGRGGARPSWGGLPPPDPPGGWAGDGTNNVGAGFGGVPTALRAAGVFVSIPGPEPPSSCLAILILSPSLIL